jgi:serine/threonine protein kinase
VKSKNTTATATQEPTMREEPTLCPGCFLNDWAGGPCARCGYVLDPEAFPTALQPGTVLSKYAVGRVLGKPGGFGITYLAFDGVLERRVALKELMPRELVARRPDGETLRVQTREDEALFNYTLTSFLNEARVIAQLSHPNVVRVLDFFEANGTAYFTMEFYEGETLAEYARRAGGHLSGDDAVALLLPLLDALDHIHSLDEPILHRDIKPANIYLTGRGAPILLDFGAARVALGQQSRSLSAVLTPGFAPSSSIRPAATRGPGRTSTAARPRCTS